MLIFIVDLVSFFTLIAVNGLLLNCLWSYVRALAATDDFLELSFCLLLRFSAPASCLLFLDFSGAAEMYTSALHSRTRACCQNLLLSHLLPCAWIFHDHLSCSSAADLSLGTAHPLLSILLKPKPMFY